MAFETFQRQRLKSASSPEVTIQQKGIFALNKAAYEALASPAAVELLYDRDERLVGIKKVDPEAPTAYAVRPLGRGATFLFSGTAFTHWYGIETPIARRWPASMDGGMLVVDLKQKSRVSQANRKGKAKAGI